MIRLLWTASTEVRYLLRRYMPSNILLDLIRTRNGLKWGVPAMLLAAPYLGLAAWDGSTSWSWSVSGTLSRWSSLAR